MVRKKTEGNEEQRRAAAREAREAGVRPSALQETTGASKQRDHRPRSEAHEEKQAALHQGKQGWQGAGAAVLPPPEAPVAFGPEGHEYTVEHERVFGAVAAAQGTHQGEGTYLEEVVARSGLPEDRVRGLLHELSAVFRLVTQLRGTDSPDLGPRYEVKPRL